MRPVMLVLFTAAIPALGTAGCGGEARFERAGVADAPAVKQAEGAAEFGAAGAAVPVERRIIHTGYLTVYVEDFDAAREALLEFVESRNGYVAQSEITGQSGERRTGTWTLRVPVKDFQGLVDAASALGTQESYRTDSQDVTEEYVDLEARIKNARVHEESLNDLMKKDQGTVEDKTKLSEAVATVRGEIERMEGRKRYLTELSAMATAHVTFEERKDYTPPSSLGFGDEVGGVFADSLEALETFGKGVVLAIVAVVPWLPLIVVGVGGIWWVVRRGRRRSLNSAAEKA